jgi:hypothetical protein
LTFCFRIEVFQGEHGQSTPMRFSDTRKNFGYLGLFRNVLTRSEIRRRDNPGGNPQLVVIFPHRPFKDDLNIKFAGHSRKVKSLRDQRSN